MIKEILEDFFLSQEKEYKEHKDSFFPTFSSAYINYEKYKKLEGKCIRAAYYHCKGYAPDEEEFSLQRELIFKIGDYTERLLLNLLQKSGRLVEAGTKFKIKKYNISGRLDAIIKDDDGRLVGVEIKSINSNKWTISQIFGSKWNKPTPKWQNLFQTLIYAYAFREKIDKFILIYIRRDNCEIQEFEVSIIPKDGKLYPVINGQIDERFTINDILDRYSILYKYLEKNKVPPREYIDIYPEKYIHTYYKLGIISKKQFENYKQEPFGDFECRFCEYKKRCKEDS